MSDRSDQKQAQAPFTPTFARLGRSVWFTLESAHRADADRASSLEERLDQVGSQVGGIASMGIAWMRVGEWNNRRQWSDEEWVAFLRTWKAYAGQVFMSAGDDDTPAEEKQLFNSFVVYWTYYANLPGVPELPEGAPPDFNMQAAADRVDMLLSNFESRLGDPLAPCKTCGKCALGRKLQRCGRCQRAFYCGVACQKVDWKRGHKAECSP